MKLLLVGYMAEAKVEILGAALCALLTVMGVALGDHRVALMLYMAGGGAGGALLGALGGKQMGLLEFGMKTIVMKIAANVCVLIMFGPLALDYALGKFPEMDAPGLASATGGCLCLFGTSALIMAVPMLLAGARAVLSRPTKWLNQPTTILSPNSDQVTVTQVQPPPPGPPPTKV